MKKTFFKFLLLAILIMSCVTGGATSSNVANVSPIDELDPAIREASTYLNTRIPQGRKAVFLNITSDYPDLSEYILSLLSENAVNDGIFSVVDRAQLDALRAEMNFQLSGEVDDNSAQAIGKLLGAETIVSGTANKIGSLYRFQVKAIEVQTASVQGQWSKTVNGNGAIIAALTEKLVPASRISPVVAIPAVTPSSGSSGTTPAATPATPPASTTPVTQIPPAEQPAPVVVYKIGDTGPAGGIIFYDKADYIDGWRYLEAAIRDVGNVVLGPGGDGTKVEIGTGKTNTQIRLDYMMQTGQNTPAVMMCQQYSQGGFNDWFLPSMAELNLMYWNLKQHGLGGFGNGNYLSSSQAGYTGQATTQNFSDGSQWQYNSTSIAYSVRPIRQF